MMACSLDRGWAHIDSWWDLQGWVDSGLLPHLWARPEIFEQEKLGRSREPNAQSMKLKCELKSMLAIYLKFYVDQGHSPEHVAGHHLYLMDAKPPTGWNGRYGYRRNTPDLRTHSSCFGEVTWLPIH
ncbi:sperm microtubule associated protein 1 isoform X1 [Candoia aspera]|uniref:sperm microtubule associated protein 1 isoform X1 n=1 Tax=Candoia aspera TaxID=51853 RepID=UPI002FD7B01D